MQTTVKKALRIKSGKGPSWLRNIYSRYIFLAIFLLLMAIVLISGRQLPVLPAMLVIGVFLTFFFSESLWHRWLCPYGTLLRLPALASRKRLQINKSKCNSCGICSSVCPSDAIKNFAAEKSNDSNMKNSYRLNSAECLLCLECVRSCPPRSISYNRNIQN